jgi:hypothetical protein
VILKLEGGIILTNIIDGMDAARFTSANPNYKKKKKGKGENRKTPLVLKNLKNGS